MSMPVKRERGRPKKTTGPAAPQAAAPNPIKRGRGRPPKTEPTHATPTTSSLPAPAKRKRGRPAKNEHDTTSAAATASSSAVRKRGRPGKKQTAPPANRSYAAKRILDENETQYLIEWDVNDPKTGKPYKPSWHSKICANSTLVEEWEEEKQSEWAAKGILDEKPDYYLIAWETDPKTNEVFRDTWEPKSFASKTLVKQWKQLQAKKRAEAKKARDPRPADDNEAIASDAGPPTPLKEGEEEEESEEEEKEAEEAESPKEKEGGVEERPTGEGENAPEEKNGEHGEKPVEVGAEAPNGTDDASEEQSSSGTGTGTSSPMPSPSPSPSPSRNEAGTDEDKGTQAAPQVISA